MILRALFCLLLVATVLGACSDDSEPASPAPECGGLSFRACETDACVGSQQCQPNGRYGPCSCNVSDASYVDSSDGGSAPSDGGADSDAASIDAAGGDSAPEVGSPDVAGEAATDAAADDATSAADGAGD